MTQYLYQSDSDLNASIFKEYVKNLGDEYSEYYSPSEYAALVSDVTGQENKSLVIEYTASPDGYAITQVPDSLGNSVSVNDKLLSINGTAISDLTEEEISSLIQEAGQSVIATIEKDSGEQINVEIQCVADEVKSVDGRMLNETIGYILISQFYDYTVEQFDQLYSELKNSGATSIILDLRNNTGGMTSASIKLAERFVKNGQTIGYLTTRDNENESIVSSGDDVNDLNIILLVNQYTASASEIFVGALVDNEIAKVVGTKTYGKGYSQTIYELEDGSGLKLTTGEYLRPNMERIQDTGILPNIEVQEDESQEGDEQLKAAIDELLQ